MRVAATVVALLVTTLAPGIGAQEAPQAQPRRSPRAVAPIDLTGTWVSVVTEDWRYRMVTPPRGDYAGVPINDVGRKAADLWDDGKDRATGNACRMYGAAGVMRMPGRVRISWQDDDTLKIETDAGAQTRLLRFGASPQRSAVEAPSWQGVSRAQWELAVRGRALGSVGGAIPADGPIPPADDRGGRGAAGRGGPPEPPGGSLKVVTTQMKPGYLRRNGVPYSANAVLTEYFDRHSEPNGDQWFIVTTIVEDPTYLVQPFVTSTHFKKEADASKWHPTPCGA
jgi:hypothetical protein